MAIAYGWLDAWIVFGRHAQAPPHKIANLAPGRFRSSQGRVHITNIVSTIVESVVEARVMDETFFGGRRKELKLITQICCPLLCCCSWPPRNEIQATLSAMGLGERSKSLLLEAGPLNAKPNALEWGKFACNLVTNCCSFVIYSDINRISVHKSIPGEA